eukprot:TRINITY_DN1622_c0_g1_i2.p1 TRINITY_DN1622_c0_g1~~TRINITY_DN1622_c0_g1_i2.p1  ORF type:complete len:642 (-),score=185.27 TRINITY_DN1622_c0_g1_i2:266-2191(-)
MSSAAIKSGILSVKGNLASGKISSKKYIVTVVADGTLTLAKEKNKDETEGILHIGSNFIVGAPKKKEFSLESPDKSRELKFSCATDEEADQWYQTIAGVISALGRTYVGADLTVATNNQVEIPALIVNALKRIRVDMKTQGIFRLSGAKPDVDRLKKAFNNGERPAMQSEDPHAVTGILKQYLRELPDPLCTFALYSDFLRAVQSPNNADALTTVVQSLPAINQAVLKVLSEFLWEVAQFESVNMMGFQNLAIVFGPTILRTKEETFETISNSGLVCQVAQVLIERSATIFAKIPLPKSAVGLLGSSADTPAGPPPPTSTPAGPPPPSFTPGPPPPMSSPPPPAGNPGPPPPTGNPAPPPPSSNPAPPPPMGMPPALPQPGESGEDAAGVAPPPRPAFQLPPVLPKLRPVAPPKTAPTPPPSGDSGAGAAPAPSNPAPTPAPASPAPPAGIKLAIPLPGKRPAPPPIPSQPVAPTTDDATPAAPSEDSPAASPAPSPAVTTGAPPQRPLQASGSSPTIPGPGGPPKIAPRPLSTLRRSMPPTASVELDAGESDSPQPSPSPSPAPAPAEPKRPMAGPPSALAKSGSNPRVPPASSGGAASSDVNSPDARLTALEDRMTRLEALQAEQKTMLERILEKLQSH